jgi:DNA-binding transcriptional MerR regulator
MAFTVGELSRLTGVTVRALHHYDQIGLVVPSHRTAAGYRLYDEEDVRRLQQVLVLRQLGVPLEAIARAIDGGTRDEVLNRQREALITRRAQLDAMLASLDAALTKKKGTIMSDDAVQSMFAGFDPKLYEAEAEQRWGDTDAYQESARRTRRYGKAEWDQIRAEADAIYTRLAAHMRAGTSVDAAVVQVIVAEHRAHIDRWFYPCRKELHKGLGEMYVADPRFTASLDAKGTGFARYLRDAIAAS